MPIALSFVTSIIWAGEAYKIQKLPLPASNFLPYPATSSIFRTTFNISVLKHPQNGPISILFSMLYTPTIKSYNFIYILIVTSSDRLTIRAENKVSEQNDKLYS